MNGSRGSSLNGTLQFLDEMPADYLGGLNQQLAFLNQHTVRQGDGRDGGREVVGDETGEDMPEGVRGVGLALLQRRSGRRRGSWRRPGCR